jgi:hypothetical protein
MLVITVHSLKTFHIFHYYIWADYSTKFFHISIFFIFLLNWAPLSLLLPRKFFFIATTIAYLRPPSNTHGLQCLVDFFWVNSCIFVAISMIINLYVHDFSTFRHIYYSCDTIHGFCLRCLFFSSPTS